MWRLEQPPAATAEGSRDDGAPASAWVLPYWARVSRRRDDWWWWWWRRVGVWAHYLASRRRLGSLSRVASTSGFTISLSRLSISLFPFFFFFLRLSLSPLGLLLSFDFWFSWVMGSCLLGWPAGLWAAATKSYSSHRIPIYQFIYSKLF